MSAADATKGAVSTTEPSEPTERKLRYAIKTSLSLTLAYLIPMSLGWPQAQIAATTVLLIAATGAVSDSLQKGVLRVIGTVAGAILGIALVALFPQDRMVYLIAVSCTVAVIFYLYNAYQGDSTVFMLTAVVTLMVFNGGDADGAFLYGVDRAFMTAFGVIVYTVVASVLWPVKTADTTRVLAAGVAATYQRAFERLHSGAPADQGLHREELDTLLTELLSQGSAFQAQFARAKDHADGVVDYLSEWNCVVSDYEQLEALMLPALKQTARQSVEFEHYIPNYDLVICQIDELFGAIIAAWRGERDLVTRQALEVEFDPELLQGERHLVIAPVAARVELLRNIQAVLLNLHANLHSLQFDQGTIVATRQPRGAPTFVWLDLENFKTSIRAFVSFWFAAAIWIAFNPPGGYMFVTLCTVLIPLVSFTPVTPKLLIILFSLGFLFALPAYVFLLPQLTHWLELAVFLFIYGFIGFYVFKGPVSIFFLFGLFTLGIQNSMNYHFDAILLTIAMFYLICATLIVSMYFPFSSKPQNLYASLRRRFFRHCARMIRDEDTAAPWWRTLPATLLGDGATLVEKMHHWGARIDPSLLVDSDSSRVIALNRDCELLHGQLQILALRRADFDQNPLVKAAKAKKRGGVMASLCDDLALHDAPSASQHANAVIASIELQLDAFLGDDYLDRYDVSQLAQFYVYLNLQISIYSSIEACRKAQVALDWQRLGETRF